MSLLGPLIGLADDITKSLGLQAQVTHHIWIRQSGSGEGDFYSVKLSAIVEQRRKVLYAPGGKEIATQASILFLQPITLKGKDKLVLDDGTTGPILTTNGFVDDTNERILTQVFLGM